MKTIGLARLGRDAELRYTPGGDAVCNLSLAVNYGKKGQDGNRPTQWIDASLWGKQAEALAQFLTKGSVHCFELSDIHIEQYQGQNGPGHKLVARVDSVELGPRVEQQQGQQHQGQQQQRAPQQQQQRAPQQQNNYAAARGQSQQGWGQPQQSMTQSAHQTSAQNMEPQSAPPVYNEPPMNFDDDYRM